MPLTLTMPKLSPTMERGTLVKWHKQVGDRIEGGEVILEVATDKATLEYQALDESWLRQILVQEGQEAAVNEPIAVLTTDENESIEGYQIQKVSVEVKEEEKGELLPIEGEGQEGEASPASEDLCRKKEETLLVQPRCLPEPPLEQTSFEHPTKSLEKRLLASPLAKRLAKEKGLDLSTVKGSGPNQRIMSRDLANAQLSAPFHFGRRPIPSLPGGSFEEEPLSPMRKTIGRRLQESKSFIPHFYVTQTCDAEPLYTLREQLKSQEVKLSINDFIVKASALALRQHPAINAGFHSVNQSIIRFKTIDIAIAVSIESGLITPIVRHTDYKTLGEIALEIRVLAQKAREGKLTSQEYKGGSFTISNLGMYGVTEFQAILNPPQAAILAVGGIQDVPVVRKGVLVAGKTLNLNLSVDHRVIDGVAAAQFLQTLKKMLEAPAILLINDPSLKA